MEKVIYVDNSATTKINKEVIEEMLPYLDDKYGNASSIHLLGRSSRQAIDEARRKIAEIINCKEEEIYFTSGGSESDTLIIQGIARANKNKGKHIITTKIEHMAVINTCKRLEQEGFEVTYMDVDEFGLVNVNEVKKKIRPDTILISVMAANNEIGSLEPIDDIAKLARFKEIYFHTDAVQAIGYKKIDVSQMQVDAISFSAHKFHGPKGVGVAYIKEGIDFEPIIFGGHQESSKRAGTENVAGIVGIAKALEIASKNIDEKVENVKSIRDYALKKIMEEIPGVKLNGHLLKRLPGNINIRIKGVDAMSLLILLDKYGICASTGSACNSGNVEPSHVLTAIGLNEEEAKSSIRFTIGEDNTIQEMEYIVIYLKEILNKFK